MWENQLSVLAQWIICAMAVERITEVIIHSSLLFDVRNYVSKRAYSSDESDNSKFLFIKLNDLIGCAWCTSHWVAAIIAFFLPNSDTLSIGNVVIKWFALVFIANLLHAFFRLVFNGRVKTVDVELKLNGAAISEDEMVVKIHQEKQKD